MNFFSLFEILFIIYGTTFCLAKTHINNNEKSDCTIIKKYLENKYDSDNIGDKCCEGENGIECVNGYITKFNK